MRDARGRNREIDHDVACREERRAVAADGETNWLEGVQLLAVYAILAAVFFFLPGGA